MNTVTYALCNKHTDQVVDAYSLTFDNDEQQRLHERNALLHGPSYLELRPLNRELDLKVLTRQFASAPDSVDISGKMTA